MNLSRPTRRRVCRSRSFSKPVYAILRCDRPFLRSQGLRNRSNNVETCRFSAANSKIYRFMISPTRIQRGAKWSLTKLSSLRLSHPSQRSRRRSFFPPRFNKMTQPEETHSGLPTLKAHLRQCQQHRQSPKGSTLRWTRYARAYRALARRPFHHSSLLVLRQSHPFSIKSRV